MKLAVVVQRYGPTVNGGAELHARYIAERLARHADVEVLTTCATDYVTWRNELTPGVEMLNGVSVRRFKVKHERDPLAFGQLSDLVFDHDHAVADELAWLDAEGPTSPALVDYLTKHAQDWDYCIFFSYRYYHAFYGVRAVAAKAILVPTAERDSTIGLSIFPPIFRGVRALMYNSPEEKTMIQAVASNQDVPSVVVGVGSEVPSNAQPHRFRQKHNIRGPYAVYVGRIDANKGCKELFTFFTSYLREEAGQLTLVLIGRSHLEIPEHPRIRHVGFVDDTEKFDAMAGAELLLMPSYFESLSMVALEAWALGKPVLANGKCDVLKGQCIRSNAGLYYEGASEFIETLRAIEHNRWVAASLGRNGRQFYRDHYDWPVIERKYLDMLARLPRETATGVEPLPDKSDRHRPDCPAGASRVATLPAGPSTAPEFHQPRPPEPEPPPMPARPLAERSRPPQQTQSRDRDRDRDRRDKGRFRRRFRPEGRR